MPRLLLNNKGLKIYIFLVLAGIFYDPKFEPEVIWKNEEKEKDAEVPSSPTASAWTARYLLISGF